MAEERSALEALGLSENEIEVYRATLSSGTRPASVIAKRAGLKRAHTYNILEALKTKGIVQETIKNNIRHYCPLPPTSLVSIVEQQVGELVAKKKKLERVVPMLESLRSPLFTQPKVRLFQGKEGVREIFEDILRCGLDMYSIVDLRHSWSSVDQESHHWIENFIARREERNICWHAIAVKSPQTDAELRWRSAKNRKVKAIDELIIPAEINIYGNKVALTSTNGEMVAALVENEPIAKTLRGIHAYLWNTLPDYVID